MLSIRSILKVPDFTDFIWIVVIAARGRCALEAQVKIKRRVTLGSVCGWLLVSFSRGLAFFLGAYAALSLIGVLLGSGYNTNSWWIDLNNLPRLASLLLQACMSTALLLFSLEVPRNLFWRITGATICGFFAYMALQNALAVYQIAEQGIISLGFPIPFSLFIMVAFVLLALAMLFGNGGTYWRMRVKKKRKRAGIKQTVTRQTGVRQTGAKDVVAQAVGAHKSEAELVGEQNDESQMSGMPASETPISEVQASVAQASETPASETPASEALGSGLQANGRQRGDRKAAPDIRRHRPPRLVTAVIVVFSVVLCGVAFPLGQIFCFGMTDYRSPADPVDAVVIFGAQVHPDGRLSTTLRNRVDAGIELYEQGCTQMLIMSGGTGWEGVNEAEAMRLYAIERGVPATAILVDRQGNSTELSVENTKALAQEYGLERLGAVSSFYHMARIKMLYLYEGIDVSTVPASSAGEGIVTQRAAFREIPGWWFYWFKNLLM